MKGARLGLSVSLGRKIDMGGILAARVVFVS